MKNTLRQKLDLGAEVDLLLPMAKQKSKKKYLSLALLLEKYLSNFPRGSKLPPMRAVAERYNVSMVTLNSALIQLEGKGIIERRHGSGVFVSHKKRNKHLVLLRNDFASPLFDLRIQAVHEVCHLQGWGLTVIQTSTYYPDDFTAIEGEYDGILLMGDAVPQGSMFFRALLDKKIPIVRLGVESEQPGIDSVAHDNFLGIKLLLDHLKAFGHSRIGLLVNEYHDHNVILRRRAFIEMTAQMNLTSTIIDCGTKSGQDASLAVLGPFGEHLKEYSGSKAFTGIIAISDVGAIGALRTLHEHGIPLSQRHVVGFDDSPISSIFIPSLTTLAWNPTEMARRALQIIERRLEGDGSSNLRERVRPELVVRESAPSRPRERPNKNTPLT